MNSQLGTSLALALHAEILYNLSNKYIKIMQLFKLCIKKIVAIKENICNEMS